MIEPLIALMESNAPMLVICGFGFWRVLIALHKLELRMLKIETEVTIRNDARSKREKEHG